MIDPFVPVLFPLLLLGSVYALLRGVASIPWGKGTALQAYREDLVHEGQLYMRRWVVLLFGWGVRIHRILLSDGTRHPHDHPWGFVSIVLWGSYSHWVTREAPDGTVTEGVKARGMASVATLGPRTAHRITYVSQGGAWTLCVSTPPRRGWGFWVPGAFLDTYRVDPTAVGGWQAATGRYWVSAAVYFRALLPRKFQNERVYLLGDGGERSEGY